MSVSAHVECTLCFRDTSRILRKGIISFFKTPQSQSGKAKDGSKHNPNTTEATARSQAQGLPGQVSKNLPQHKRQKQTGIELGGGQSAAKSPGSTPSTANKLEEERQSRCGQIPAMLMWAGTEWGEQV